MIAQTLKPCPFCGGKPAVHGAQIMVGGDCPESIGCDNDDCLVSLTTGYMPYHLAVASWNTRPETDRLIAEAVKAERERLASWHDREATGAMNSLHCGSENSEYRAASRLHDFHKAIAATIRGQS